MFVSASEFEKLREDFFSRLSLCAAGAEEVEWGVGLGFQQGHVAFLKAFPGREPCGDYSLCKWEFGSPRETYMTHQTVLFCLFFPKWSSRAVVENTRLGRESGFSDSYFASPHYPRLDIWILEASSALPPLI